VKKLCECGCGTPVQRRFVSGHNLRVIGVTPEMCIHRSITLRRKFRYDSAYAAQHMAILEARNKSTAQRKAVSKKAKKRWSDPDFKAKLSEIGKVEMAAANRRPEKRKQISDGVLRYYEEHGTYQYTPEQKAIFSAARRKLWEDPKYRQTMARATNRRVKMDTKKAGTFYCRLSWEEAFTKLVDSSPLVKRFVYEPFGIPYVWKGKDRTYYPDFLLELKTGEKFVVEIKGKERPRDLAKYMAAERYCRNHGMEFAIIREKPMEPLSRYIQ
jgi:hypothetical protein